MRIMVRDLTCPSPSNNLPAKKGTSRPFLWGWGNTRGTSPHANIESRHAQAVHELQICLNERVQACPSSAKCSFGIHCFDI